MAEWSVEDRERVIELWNEGASAADLAAIFNKSRNAIIGVVHRWGGKKKERSTKRIKPATVQKPPQKDPAPEIPVETEPEAIPLAWPVPDAPKHPTVFTVRDNQCRWVNDNGTLCGEPIARKGTYWCPHHYGIVYRPLPSRR